MKKDIKKSESGRFYMVAHEMHYTTKDLSEALELYKSVMEAYPETEEAKYCRSQIENIVNTVVPKQELFDAKLELARMHTEHKGPTDDIVASN